MHLAIQTMLERYDCKSPIDYKNALKEIMQEIALLGLYRHNFFNSAAFYGGTALRIAYGLPRFSEDLDFTLDKTNPDFDLSQYFNGIKDEFRAYGLNLITEKKTKTKVSDVESAFLKANTLEHLLMIEGVEHPKRGTNKNDIIKIKLEIDINPPSPQGKSEILYLLEPIPFSYRILTLPSLFGGKLHALICRKYQGGRVKGRDYYDFIWYIAKKVSPDLAYLKGKLCESGHWDSEEEFTIEHLKSLLDKKFKNTDWDNAKADVKVFIKDTRELDMWSTPFFKSLVQQLR